MEPCLGSDSSDLGSLEQDSEYSLKRGTASSVYTMDSEAPYSENFSATLTKLTVQERLNVLINKAYTRLRSRKDINQPLVYGEKDLSPALQKLYGNGKLTVLMEAAAKGNLDAAVWMLEHGALVDIATDKESTALHFASLAGHPPLVQLFIDNQADVDVLNRDGGSPLLYALDIKNEDVVRQLVKADADPHLLSIERDTTPFIHAARTGELRFVQLLLDDEGFVDVADQKKRTALSWATEGGHNEVFRYLLEHGANPLITMPSGVSLFVYAYEGKKWFMIDHLLSRNPDFMGKTFNPIPALLDGQKTLLDRMTTEGAQIKDYEKSLSEALEESAKSGDQPEFLRLFDGGANPDQTINWCDRVTCMAKELAQVMRLNAPVHVLLGTISYHRGDDEYGRDYVRGGTTVELVADRLIVKYSRDNSGGSVISLEKGMDCSSDYYDSVLQKNRQECESPGYSRDGHLQERVANILKVYEYAKREFHESPYFTSSLLNPHKLWWIRYKGFGAISVDSISDPRWYMRS